MCATSLMVMAFAIAVADAGGDTFLAGDYPPHERITQQPEWPEGFADLVNDRWRVWGHWVNASEFFHYAGRVEALNKMLESYGRLQDTPLTVVLHAGRRPMTGPIGEEPRLNYDWELNIIRRGWGVPRDPRLPADKPGSVATVHVWLSDDITLDGLVIPEHITVQSAGDIERFIEDRRTRGQ
jgi:hypothetical protein